MMEVPSSSIPYKYWEPKNIGVVVELLTSNTSTKVAEHRGFGGVPMLCVRCTLSIGEEDGLTLDSMVEFILQLCSQ